MPHSTWKSTGLLVATTLLAALLICASLASLVQLPLLGWSGLALWAVLCALAALTSRLTVTVSNTEGAVQSRKSLAETFIFLATMIYATGANGTVAPATLLAALVALLSSRRAQDRRHVLLNTGAAVISTFLAAWLYAMLVPLFAGMTSGGQGSQLQLGTFLLPLCAFVITQYFLSAGLTAAYTACAAGLAQAKLTRESLIWMAITQVAGAASASLFYFAWQGGGLAFV
ncbi:MAG: hypothetical protein JO360_11535, partial [Acidobacteria bacterium]|nr:hypothetical protein [Acidobacteriota bacterium]